MKKSHYIYRIFTSKGLPFLIGTALILSSFSVKAMEEEEDGKHIQKQQPTSLGNFQVLPPEVIVHLFSFCSPKELGVLSSLSREIQKLSEENSIWKKQAQRIVGIWDLIDINKPIKNEVKMSQLFKENSDQIITIGQYISLKQTQVGSNVPRYEFVLGRRKFLIQYASNKSNLELMPTDQSVTFTWINEHRHWRHLDVIVSPVVDNIETLMRKCF